LGVLRDRLFAELDVLLDLEAACRAASGQERHALAEYCAVQMQDCWTQFLRDLVLRSALGNARRADGRVVGVGPLGRMYERDARVLIQKKWPGGKKPSYFEPNWYNFDHTSKAIQVLQPNNGNDINTAVGSLNNPIEELRAVRNFAAHRGHISASSLQQVAAVWLPNWRQPSDLLLQAVADPQGKPEARLRQWSRRFRLVAAAAVK